MLNHHNELRRGLSLTAAIREFCDAESAGLFGRLLGRLLPRLDGGAFAEPATPGPSFD